MSARWNQSERAQRLVATLVGHFIKSRAQALIQATRNKTVATYQEA